MQEGFVGIERYEANLVGEKHSFGRIIELGVNPRSTVKLKRTLRKAMEDNGLEEHLLVMLILNQNCTNLSKIFWNFKICHILHILLSSSFSVCVCFNTLVLLSRLWINIQPSPSQYMGVNLKNKPKCSWHSSFFLFFKLFCWLGNEGIRILRSWHHKCKVSLCHYHHLIGYNWRKKI